MLTLPAPPQSTTSPDLGTIAWSRGHGCAGVADLLGDRSPIVIDGDLQRSCITNRVGALVTRRLTSFDLVPVIVPRNVEPHRVRSITAAVGDSPHSPLAATVAARLAEVLGVPAELATAYRDPDELPAAIERLNRLAQPHRELGRRVTHEVSAAQLVYTLPPSTLLVVGAPGDSWFHRQMHDPGHRLLDAAPGGSIVVRSAPARAFHDAVPAAGIALSPHMRVGEARRLMAHPVVPVADAGVLVGRLRYAATADASPNATVFDVMEPPIAVGATETATAAAELATFLDSSPIPVVDGAGRLVGVIPQGAPSGMSTLEKIA
jgi:hypothetical protein